MSDVSAVTYQEPLIENIRGKEQGKLALTPLKY